MHTTTQECGTHSAHAWFYLLGKCLFYAHACSVGRRERLLVVLDLVSGLKVGGKLENGLR